MWETGNSHNNNRILCLALEISTTLTLHCVQCSGYFKYYIVVYNLHNVDFKYNEKSPKLVHCTKPLVKIAFLFFLLVSTSTRLVVDWISMDIWYFRIDGNVESWCHNDYRVWQGAIGGQWNDTCYMVTLHTHAHSGFGKCLVKRLLMIF